MPNDPTSELRDEFLAAVRKSQDAVVDAIKTWAETVQSVVPAMPAVPVPPMPDGVQVAKPEEVVAGAYDFAEQLLASQRQFAENLLKATSPLLPGGDHK